MSVVAVDTLPFTVPASKLATLKVFPRAEVASHNRPESLCKHTGTRKLEEIEAVTTYIGNDRDHD